MPRITFRRFLFQCAFIGLFLLVGVQQALAAESLQLITTQPLKGEPVYLRGIDLPDRNFNIRIVPDVPHTFHVLNNTLDKAPSREAQIVFVPPELGEYTVQVISDFRVIAQTVVPVFRESGRESFVTDGSLLDFNDITESKGEFIMPEGWGVPVQYWYEGVYGGVFDGEILFVTGDDDDVAWVGQNENSFSLRYRHLSSNTIVLDDFALFPQFVGEQLFWVGLNDDGLLDVFRKGYDDPLLPAVAEHRSVLAVGLSVASDATFFMSWLEGRSVFVCAFDGGCSASKKEVFRLSSDAVLSSLTMSGQYLTGLVNTPAQTPSLVLCDIGGEASLVGSSASVGAVCRGGVEVVPLGGPSKALNLSSSGSYFVWQQDSIKGPFELYFGSFDKLYHTSGVPIALTRDSEVDNTSPTLKASCLSNRLQVAFDTHIKGVPTVLYGTIPLLHPSLLFGPNAVVAPGVGTFSHPVFSTSSVTTTSSKLFCSSDHPMIYVQRSGGQYPLLFKTSLTSAGDATPYVSTSFDVRGYDSFQVFFGGYSLPHVDKLSYAFTGKPWKAWVYSYGANEPDDVLMRLPEHMGTRAIYNTSYGGSPRILDGPLMPVPDGATDVRFSMKFGSSSSSPGSTVSDILFIGYKGELNVPEIPDFSNPLSSSPISIDENEAVVPFGDDTSQLAGSPYSVPRLSIDHLRVDEGNTIEYVPGSDQDGNLDRMGGSVFVLPLEESLPEGAYVIDDARSLWTSASIRPPRGMSWTPGSEQSGRYVVVYRLEDGLGYQAFYEQLITVSDTLEPFGGSPAPVPLELPTDVLVVPVPDEVKVSSVTIPEREWTLYEGMEFQTSIIAIVDSATVTGGERFSFEANGLPDGAVLTGDLFTYESSVWQLFQWTPSANQAGMYEVRFTVEDGLGNSFEGIQRFRVHDHLEPFVNSGIEGAEVAEFIGLSIPTPISSDPTLGIFVPQPGSVDFGIPTTEGAHIVPVDHTYIEPDLFEPSEPFVGTVAERLVFLVSGVMDPYVSSYTSEVTLSLLSPLPENVQFTPSDTGFGFFDWIPDVGQEGEYHFRFSLSDGLGVPDIVDYVVVVRPAAAAVGGSEVPSLPDEAVVPSAEVPLVVAEPGAPLDPPELVTPLPYQIREGEVLEFSPESRVDLRSGDFGIEYDILLENLPAGAIYEHGIFRWRPGNASAGTYHVRVHIRDSLGLFTHLSSSGYPDSTSVLILVEDSLAPFNQIFSSPPSLELQIDEDVVVVPSPPESAPVAVPDEVVAPIVEPVASEGLFESFLQLFDPLREPEVPVSVMLPIPETPLAPQPMHPDGEASSDFPLPLRVAESVVAGQSERVLELPVAIEDVPMLLAPIAERFFLEPHQVLALSDRSALKRRGDPLLVAPAGVPAPNLRLVIPPVSESPAVSVPDAEVVAPSPPQERVVTEGPSAPQDQGFVRRFIDIVSLPFSSEEDVATEAGEVPSAEVFLSEEQGESIEPVEDDSVVEADEVVLPTRPSSFVFEAEPAFLQPDSVALISMGNDESVSQLDTVSGVAPLPGLPVYAYMVGDAGDVFTVASGLVQDNHVFSMAVATAPPPGEYTLVVSQVPDVEKAITSERLSTVVNVTLSNEEESRLPEVSVSSFITDFTLFQGNKEVSLYDHGVRTAYLADDASVVSVSFRVQLVGRKASASVPLGYLRSTAQPLVFTALGGDLYEARLEAVPVAYGAHEILVSALTDEQHRAEDVMIPFVLQPAKARVGVGALVVRAAQQPWLAVLVPLGVATATAIRFGASIPLLALPSFRILFISLFLLQSVGVLRLYGGAFAQSLERFGYLASSGAHQVQVFSHLSGFNDPYLPLQPTYDKLSLIYDRLVMMGDDLRVQPQLATSWSIVNDTTWEFQLRKGVTFHNGKTFTARDVLADFQYLQHSTSDLADRFSNVIAVQMPDDYRVRFITSTPDPLLVQKLSLLFLVDEEDLHLLQDPSHAPNGTGPYRFLYDSPSYVVLQQSDSFRSLSDDPHYITLLGVSSPEAKIHGLATSQADVVYDLPKIKEWSFDEYLLRERTSVYSIFLLFNTSRSAFQSPESRRDLAAALRRDELLNHVVEDGFVLSQFTGPGLLGYASDLEAEEDIRASGRRYSQRLVVSYLAYEEDLFFALKQQMEEVGFSVTPQRLGAQEFVKNMEQRQSDLYVVPWIYDYGDVSQFLEMFAVAGGSARDGLYSNVQVDQLFQQSQQTFSTVERARILRELQHIITREDMIGVPLLGRADKKAVRTEKSAGMLSGVISLLVGR